MIDDFITVCAQIININSILHILIHLILFSHVISLTVEEPLFVVIGIHLVVIFVVVSAIVDDVDIIVIYDLIIIILFILFLSELRLHLLLLEKLLLLLGTTR